MALNFQNQIVKYGRVDSESIIGSNSSDLSMVNRGYVRSLVNTVQGVINAGALTVSDQRTQGDSDRDFFELIYDQGNNQLIIRDGDMDTQVSATVTDNGPIDTSAATIGQLTFTVDVDHGDFDLNQTFTGVTVVDQNGTAVGHTVVDGSADPIIVNVPGTNLSPAITSVRLNGTVNSQDTHGNTSVRAVSHTALCQFQRYFTFATTSGVPDSPTFDGVNNVNAVVPETLPITIENGDNVYIATYDDGSGPNGPYTWRFHGFAIDGVTDSEQEFTFNGNKFTVHLVGDDVIGTNYTITR